MNKRISEQRLPNGWLLVTMESEERVITAPSINTNDLGRFVARLFRCPATRELRVVHLAGSTPAERLQSERSALKAARDRSRFFSGYWERFRRTKWSRGKNVYGLLIGNPINEAEAFESITRGIQTDEDIEREFQSIIERFEVTA